ncbi:MAG: heat-inducible transcription repressor HrcA [Negativicutes bacterium]|nr:heat-inducible transcription repressor HrcA [Negativicutes bacterium]MBP9536878.1 heat-inducible transcription repressor HrcA [Negativicutes bacterium]MBP9949210.1 heat-inducible transcription repressor HrcA [Negativicutes bacterium]
MLDERKQKILQAIIDDYISTAEPIGSRTIARKYNLGVSSATIRNEMADLELLGYLEQLHTSSGRVPSGKGYRLYVDDLLAPSKISEKEINLIASWYNSRTKSIEEVFQETAKIISRLTKNVSLVMAPQLSQSTFRCLQFVALDKNQAIVIVMTDAGFIENKIIDIPHGTSIEDLQKIATIINGHLSGLMLDEIKTSLIKKIKNEVNLDLFEATFDSILKALAIEKKERLYLGGTTQLLSQPEFRNVEKVKDILTMLEEEQLLCDLLNSQNGDGVTVTIGQENKYSGIKDCSIIKATYHIKGKVIGTVAVLGPTRMEYGKIITLLEFMHGNLGQILKKYIF